MEKAAKFERPEISSVYYKLGLVADPAPELLLNKAQLAKLKIQMLDQQIAELKHQIELAETYKGMLMEEYR